jgi:hypothetical protein
LAGCNIETNKTEIWEYKESYDEPNPWKILSGLEISPLGFSFLYTHSEDIIILGGGLSPEYKNPSNALIVIKDLLLMELEVDLGEGDYFFDNQVLKVNETDIVVLGFNKSLRI